VHTGLHGTSFHSASFNDTIDHTDRHDWEVQYYERLATFEAYYSGDLVSSYERWLDGAQESLDSRRAYWIFRLYNNCSVLANVLLNEIRRIGTVFHNGNEIKASSFIKKKMGVTTKRVGTLVESKTSLTSRAPPSLDNESFHQWVEFSDGPSTFAIDLTICQFDEWPAGIGNPIAVVPASEHAQLFASIRNLEKNEPFDIITERAKAMMDEKEFLCKKLLSNPSFL